MKQYNAYRRYLSRFLKFIVRRPIIKVLGGLVELSLLLVLGYITALCIVQGRL